MRGRDVLFTKVKELVLSKHKNIEFDYIENGFQFKIEGFPYMFKVICYEQIGWNVYLSFIEEEALVEHPETDELYLKIENIVDEINYHSYGLDENIKPVIDKNFNKLTQVLDIYSAQIVSKKIVELKYIINFNNVDNITPIMIIKYSISLNKWFCNIDGFYGETNIHDELFNIFNDISLIIQGFNKPLDGLNYYF